MFRIFFVSINLVLIVTLLYCSAVKSQNKSEPYKPVGSGPGVFQDTNDPAEIEAMKKLKAQVEAVPEKDRLSVGAEITRSHLSDFKTPAVRQRMLLSLGDLYTELKQYDEAITFYKKTITENASPNYTQLAQEKLAGLYSRLGKPQEALEVLNGANQPTPNSADKNADPNRIDAGYLTEEKRINILLSAQHFEEAFNRAVELGKKYPNQLPRILGWADLAAYKYSLNTKKGDQLRLYEKLIAEFPTVHDDSILMSNWIQALLRNDRNEEVIRLSEEFIKKFPNDSSTPGYYSHIAGDYFSKDQYKEAKNYFEKILVHPKSSKEYRDVAQTNIDECIRRLTPRTVKNPLVDKRDKNDNSTSPWRFWFFIGNAVIFLSLALLTIKKRFMRSA